MSIECFYPLGDDAVSSGLSEHSSDRLQLPPPSKPIAPGVTTVTVASKKEAGSEERDGREASDDGDSELLTPSASESTLVNGKPITSQDAADTSSAKKELQEVYMYISYLHYTCIRYTCMYMYNAHVQYMYMYIIVLNKRTLG